MWLLLQLADSAFPGGAFAHSGGLEAAVQLGEVEDAEGVRTFVTCALWQAAHVALPAARAAHAAWPEGEAALAPVDARLEAFLVNHVLRRASRAQGRAFAAACARAFPETAPLDAAIRAGRLAGHLPLLQGATAAAVGATVDDAEALVLHTTARSLLSAAVRLGRLGPLEAQAVQRDLAGTMDAARAASRRVTLDDLAQTAPLADLAAALHDRLYSRLFQS